MALDAITREVVQLYDKLEIELIYQIARLARTYDGVAGNMEWLVTKLDEMGALNAAAVKLIAEYSGKSEKAIREMLKKAGFANIDAESAALANIDKAKLDKIPAFKATFNDSFKQLSATFKMINTTALESVKTAYMNVLNEAYIEVQSGAFDFSSALRRSLVRFSQEGITGATYSTPSGRTIHYSLEAVARRDTLTAVHQAANRNSITLAEQLGAGYVEVSAHPGARVSATNPIANHAGWQGKVYKINGFDANYGNLKNNTGYPDDILGLSGVNCRHRIYPFWPGKSTPHVWVQNEKEDKRIYELTQKQRAMERKIRNLKREYAALKGGGYDEEAKKTKKKLNEWYDRIIKFTEENGLQRDFDREMIKVEINERRYS